MSDSPDLAPVIVLKPAELADLAGEDDEDSFAFLQWLCAERASDTFLADMSLGPDDPVPYWPADLWPMRLTSLTRSAHGSRRRSASPPETPHVS